VKSQEFDFRIESVIGRGRQSTVYLARDAQGGKAVALKVARGDLAAEFAHQASVSHPNVIRPIAQGAGGGQAFLAMEYVSGGPLLRAGQALPAARVHRVMSETAQALAALHAGGMVHGDLKPDHLLVREDGSIALTDFGCARRTGERADLPEGAIAGTPRYAAPEQLQGEPAHPSADIYSLGVCLHEMLTGTPPFAGQTLTELFAQHLMAPVPRLPRPHARWQSLLDAMLAKDPCERPADGAALLPALAGLEAGETP
jgi:serine/threonine protein kinase